MRKVTKSGTASVGRRREVQWQQGPEEVERLRRVEEQYRRLLELAPDAVMVHQEGRLVYVNAAAVRLFGAQGVEALLGREMLELVHPAERAVVQQRAGQVLEGGEWVERRETRLVRLDGQEVVGETAVTRVSWMGAPAAQMIVRDVTERKQAEAIYHAMARSIPGGAMSVVDQDLRYVVVEGDLLEQLGLSKAGMTGHTVEEVFEAEIGRERAEHFRRALAGEVTSYETFYRQRCVWSQFVPLRDQEGHVMAAMSLAMDVTERKQAEEALRKKGERLRLLSETAGELLSGQAPEMAVRQLFGKLAQHMDLDMYFNFHLDDSGRALRLDSWAGVPEHLAREIERLTLGQAVCGTVAQERRAWVLHDVQHSAEPRAVLLRQRGVQAYACFPLLAGERLVGTLSFGSRRRQEFSPEEVDLLRTVSYYVAVAQAQTWQRRDLESTVGERTARLREMVAELEHLSYSMVHDMRAPLRAIEGCAVLIERGEGERLSAQSRELMSRMENAIHQMDQLITDVLNYNKAVRSRLPLGAVELGRVLRDLLQTSTELQPPRAEVELVGDFPRVLANEAGLMQCLAELLRNGVKFVEPGKLPRVKVWAEPIGTAVGWVRVWVEDNGTGIPKAGQSRIFDLFQRMHGAQYPGTGIGLALVRKLTERMGGRVGVDSEPGRGSRFWVELRTVSELRSQ
ncbi:MAG TPA: PAS domain S-box protein [Candidatus Sulfotelmatobacter sp.]|nr:PAS domain S-box protein [Candidatus Sulfotelmatobacter sp.]